ncbi:hypothetical protein BpHYR1_035748 [Brachionus plicatilis]|uniref:Uncharacterized protein n=1 Tax=Brachionus plicatilis TaxID=10195 RepID=A0A3M7SSX2_BRAPC|nr:hypothetical protein BpHYR1_035748 [Brachionus plicatilis]
MPDRCIASANTYGEYMNISMNAVSSEGVFRKSTNLNKRALKSPKRQPTSAEAKNMMQNSPIIEPIILNVTIKIHIISILAKVINFFKLLSIFFE